MANIAFIPRNGVTRGSSNYFNSISRENCRKQTILCGINDIFL